MLLGCALLLAAWLLSSSTALAQRPVLAQGLAGGLAEPHRSPVDLWLTPDEEYLVTANQTSDSLSLVRVQDGQVVVEVPCGRKPAAVVVTSDGKRVLATTQHAGELVVFGLQGEHLTKQGSVRLGFSPVGVAVDKAGKKAYVALEADGSVAVVDLETLAEEARIPVGPWPRYLALAPAEDRLAVALNGERTVAVVDLKSRKLLYRESFDGINAGHLQVSADGKNVYLGHMIYRHNPITVRNIQLGWVLASRISRVRMDGPTRREAISLDPRGEAIADPHGLALTADEQWLVVAAAGSQELLVYRLPTLPFVAVGGPGDHIEPQLANDSNRFYRIPLRGRPMGLRISRDLKRVFVANYLLDAIQVVDLSSRRVVERWPLGSPDELSEVRQGEMIFYDGKRSLDQWYSCHTCHYEGGTNAVTMDTWNDGSPRTFKTVLNLYHISKTGPWTWHGWQQDLAASMKKSMQDTMFGPRPRPGDTEALIAFLDSMEPLPNPYRLSDGSLTPSAARGKLVFEGKKGNCISCHQGPYFTDHEIHDVGTNGENDVYKGYSTPSLLGAHRRVRYLHHGRAESLRDVLTGEHNPAQVAGEGTLTDAELQDLIEYVKSL